MTAVARWHRWRAICGSHKQRNSSGAGGRRLYKEAVTALVHICGEDAERAIRLADESGSSGQFMVRLSGS